MLAWKILGSVLAGIRELHGIGFYHGDLNYSNIIWNGQSAKFVDIESLGRIERTHNIDAGFCYISNDLRDMMSISFLICDIMNPCREEHELKFEDILDNESYPEKSRALFQMYAMLQPLTDPEESRLHVNSESDIPNVHKLLSIFQTYN